MKKFWLVLLSLGLVMAFSASAFAVDVKFSGEFLVGGMYLDKTTLKKDTALDGPSTAFYFQRLRLQAEFVVAPGVSLFTKATIMQRAWGAARSAPGTALDSGLGGLSAGTTAENENVAFDFAYVRFATPIGLFAAGYMQDNTWGGPLADSTTANPCLLWLLPQGGLTLLAKSCKVNENSVTAKNPVAATSGADRDNTTYTVGGIYAWQAGQAGVLYKFYNYAGNKATQVAPGVYLDQNAMNFSLVSPYIIAQFGPVKVNFDFYYFWGKYISTTVAPIGEKDMQSINAQLDATATFGPIYFGGNVTYISGDDPGTSDKLEGGVGGGGADWSPCLIMWNFDRTYWAGSLAGQGTSFNANAVGSGSTATYPGAWFFQGRFGVKPTAKLDFMASASYAFADKKPTGYASDVYGWEFDITGTYKITNNLSYMLGFGYMMTGDFYKGATTGTSVRDDYLVINKLTLTF